MVGLLDDLTTTEEAPVPARRRLRWRAADLRWRPALAAAGLACTQLDTLRLALLELGGRVLQHLDHVRLRLATSYPSQPRWVALAARLSAPVRK